LPSSQLAPVRGVAVQVAVPLQARSVHVSLAQEIGVPTQVPSALQASP
jgi:hypothetical protein